MDEEQFVCQECGHHEHEWEYQHEDDEYVYECTNCFHQQHSLSGSREEE